MSRVALIGENSVEYIDILINIWNNGDCAVLIDCQIPPQTAFEMMLDARVSSCYIEQKYYEKIQNVSDEIIELIPYEQKNTLTQLLQTEIYNKFTENYSKEEAIVIYSSGTTGQSKGIILSHYAINTNADAIIDYIKPCIDDRMYIVKNLTHSSTITGELLVALKTRVPLLIAPVVVPPRYVIKNIVDYKITIIGVNPLLLSMYCAECQNRKYNLSSLKRIYVSGSILDDKTYRIAHDVFSKQEIYNVYGLSEAGPRVSAQRSDCCKGNSVGKSIKGVEVIVVDEDGNIVLNGERGIVHVSTPSKFDGYIQGTQKYGSLYQDWLNTGDIGYLDELEELHIVGRVDDRIIINSHKVYPSEIERQVLHFSDIKECVVTMVTFNKEDCLCCLYVSENKIREDIKNVLSTVLMRYEMPKVFIKANEIPKTQNGKVSLVDVKENILRALKGV